MRRVLWLYLLSLDLLTGCAHQAPSPRTPNPHRDTQLYTAQTNGPETVPPWPLFRWAHTAELAKLDPFFAVDSTCRSLGYAEIRVTHPPAHGKVTSEQTQAYPGFATNNRRFHCNRSLADSTEVVYQSEDAFKGDDEFTIEVRFPDGSLRVVRYAMLVDALSTLMPPRATRMAADSGQKDKVEAYFSLTPTCESKGYAIVIVVRRPSHGTLSIETGQDYPQFAEETAQYGCDRQLSASTEVFYRSYVGFRGNDSFELEVLWPDRYVRRISYVLEVR